MAFVVAGLLLLTELVHSVWLVRVPVWGQIADPAIPLIIAISFRRPDWGPVVGLGVGVLGGTVLVDQPLLPWIVTALATGLQQVILVIVLAVTDLLPVSFGAFGRPLLAQVGLNLLAVWPAFAVTRLLLRAPRAARPRGRVPVI